MFKQILTVVLLLSLVHVNSMSHRGKNFAHFVAHTVEKLHHMNADHSVTHDHEHPIPVILPFFFKFKIT